MKIDEILKILKKSEKKDTIIGVLGSKWINDNNFIKYIIDNQIDDKAFTGKEKFNDSEIESIMNGIILLNDLNLDLEFKLHKISLNFLDFLILYCPALVPKCVLKYGSITSKFIPLKNTSKLYLYYCIKNKSNDEAFKIIKERGLLYISEIYIFDKYNNFSGYQNEMELYQVIIKEHNYELFKLIFKPNESQFRINIDCITYQNTDINIKKYLLSLTHFVTNYMFDCFKIIMDDERLEEEFLKYIKNKFYIKFDILFEFVNHYNKMKKRSIEYKEYLTRCIKKLKEDGFKSNNSEVIKFLMENDKDYIDKEIHGYVKKINLDEIKEYIRHNDFKTLNYYIENKVELDEKLINFLVKQYVYAVRDEKENFLNIIKLLISNGYQFSDKDKNMINKQFKEDNIKIKI